MILFTGHREYRAALAVAAAGGQALFLHPWGGPSRIRCFDGVRWIGKLFDQDKTRLVATARRLGVRRVVIDREDLPEQHVALVAGPLQRARAECVQGNLLEVRS
jgi:hypothetical protein